MSWIHQPLPAAGVVDYVGRLAAVVPFATGDLNGDHGTKGVLAASTQALTGDLNGTHIAPVTGALAATVAFLTGDLNGNHGTKGSFAATPQALVGDLNGVQAATGALAATTQLPAGDLNGEHAPPVEGTFAATTQALAGDLNGVQAAVGALAATTQELSGDLNGVQAASGALAATTQELTGDLDGYIVLPDVGTLSGVVQLPTGDLDGVQAAVGVLAATTQELTANLDGVQAAIGTLAGVVPLPLGDLNESAQAVEGPLHAEVQALAGSFSGAHGVADDFTAEVLPIEAYFLGYIDVEGALAATVNVQASVTGVVTWPNVPSAFPPGVGQGGGGGATRTILWDRSGRGTRAETRAPFIVARMRAVVSAVQGRVQLDARPTASVGRITARVEVRASLKGEQGQPIPLSEVLRRLRDFFATGIWDGERIALPNDAGENLALHTMSLLGDPNARADLVARLGPEIESLYTLESRLDLARRRA